MWILTLTALYLLARYAKKSSSPSAGRVLPIILESLALILLVIWRTVSATTRINRF
jgi:hypothetical protein